MATKRMFSNKVLDTDDFIMLSIESQILYIYLNMSSDDDGFTKQAIKTIKMLGLSDANLKELEDNNYIYKFDSGVVVIRDFKIHNTIQNDRYNKTIYQDEFNLLVERNKKYYLKSDLADTGSIQNDSNAEAEWKQDGNDVEADWIQEDDNYLMENDQYNLDKTENTPFIDDDSNMEADWIQDGSDTETQIRLDKNRLEKNRLDEINGGLNENIINSIINTWNNCSGKEKIIQIQSITNKRKNNLINIINEYGYDGLMKAIENIDSYNYKDSDKMYFDWFIEKSNFEKVLNSNDFESFFDA